MDEKPRYWFPAKRYGWGWGPPLTWEGWVALVAFLALTLAGMALFPPERQPWFYLGYLVLLCGGFMGVCWLKGEPTRWRWGGD